MQANSHSPAYAEPSLGSRGQHVAWSGVALEGQLWAKCLGQPGEGLECQARICCSGGDGDIRDYEQGSGRILSG